MNDLEIKLHALQMSKSLLLDCFYQEKEIERANWEAIKNIAEQKGESFENLKTKLSFPNENEVVKKAKVFNDFIFG